MAFTAGITGVLGQNEAGSTTLVSATLTANAGDLVLVMIACDNTSTTDGDFSEVLSITDDIGNFYIKIKEWTNGQGAAAAGATVAAFYSNIVYPAAANTATITFANSVVSKCACYMRFTKAANNRGGLAGAVQTEVVDNADAGALTIGSLSSKQYLFIRVIASETDGFGITTFTTSYLTTGNNRSGAGGSEKGHMSVQGEYRIFTGTGDTSNPALTDTTVDLASIYFALQEVPFTASASGKSQKLQAVNRAASW